MAWRVKFNDDWLVTVLVIVSGGHLILPVDPKALVIHHWMYALLGFGTLLVRWGLGK
jgi:hypothetical protein